MTPEEISKMLRQVRRGRLNVEDAVDRLRNLPYEDLGYAKIDHHRSLRHGLPEVIFARGKRPEQVEGIVRRMLRNRHVCLNLNGAPLWLVGIDSMRGKQYRMPPQEQARVDRRMGNNLDRAMEGVDLVVMV